MIVTAPSISNLGEATTPRLVQVDHVAVDVEWLATVNGDAFYYISQKAHRSAAFMPHEIVDQRVIAVYFDKQRRVERLANYGLKDGKVFDYLSQTTETGGHQLSYLRAGFKNMLTF